MNNLTMLKSNHQCRHWNLNFSLQVQTGKIILLTLKFKRRDSHWNLNFSLEVQIEKIILRTLKFERRDNTEPERNFAKGLLDFEPQGLDWVGFELEPRERGSQRQRCWQRGWNETCVLQSVEGFLKFLNN